MSVTAAMLGNILGYQTATTETVCGKRRSIKQCAQNEEQARKLLLEGNMAGEGPALCTACIRAYQTGVQFGAPPLIWPDECRRNETTKPDGSK